MGIARFRTQGQVVLDEPKDPSSRLEIELESTAQIGPPNAGRSDAGTRIEKGYPRGSSREIVTARMESGPRATHFRDGIARR